MDRPMDERGSPTVSAPRRARSGLRRYERDAGLLGRWGDGALAPPSGTELACLVREHLLQPGASDVRDVSWELARYKPGTSLTTVHAVALEDGAQTLVTCKRYADGKAETLTDRLPVDAATARLAAPFLPAAALPEERLVLSAFPVDRVLRGLHRLRDVRRTARLLEECGWCGPRDVKKRRVSFELLRFKPERRAVLRVGLRLRSSADGGERFVAARVLPPDVLARALRERRPLAELGLEELAPRVLGSDHTAGIVLEEWIDGEHPAPGPDLAHEAGRLLARLHTLCATDRVPDAPRDARALLPLLSVDPGLARAAEFLRPLRSSARPTLCHGDFHEEQLLLRRGDLVLLDLDDLAVGDPVSDLASYVADVHARAPEGGVADEVARALFTGYLAGGGERVPLRELQAAVAEALVHRAAGALRRLERGALERARRLVEIARAAAPGRTVLP